VNALKGMPVFDIFVLFEEQAIFDKYLWEKRYMISFNKLYYL